MKFKFIQKQVLTQLFFFFFFLVLPALAFQRLPNESLFTTSRVILQDTIGNFILLCFFYLNYYILIPQFYFQRRYFLYVGLVIIFLGLTFPLPHLISNLLPEVHRNFPMVDVHDSNNFHPHNNPFPNHPPFDNHPPSVAAIGWIVQHISGNPNIITNTLMKYPRMQYG